MEDSQTLESIAKTYPFLSFCRYSNSEYLGIIQNSDNQLVSMYVYNLIPTKEQKKYFLHLGDLWWWGSSRKCPINLFLKVDFLPFKPFLRTFARKELNILFGPCLSLNDTGVKKPKRRQITLIKKII